MKRKRDKNKWHRRIYCKYCKGYKTYGGYKLLWFHKIKTWEHNECKCKKLASYGFPKEQQDDNKRTN